MDEDKPNVINLTCDSDTGSESFSESGLDMTKQRFALWILKTLAYTRFLNVWWPWRSRYVTIPKSEIHEITNNAHVICDDVNVL